MSFRFSLHFLIASGAILILNALNAVEPPTYFDVSGGYRIDRVTCRVDAHSEPHVFLLADKLKAKDIKLYVAGAKAQIALCDYWYLKAYGDYCWGNSGKYSEKIFEPCDLTKSVADLHKTRARDYQIGFGYIYPVDGCWGSWGLGPVWGWSYSDQKVILRNAKTDCIPDPVLNGVVYKNRWSGPWLGIDAIYRYCNTLLKAGFEYHWVWWHATWTLDGPDIPFVAFSDSRESHQAHGCVLYFDAKWEFYHCWHIGFGLKARFFEARTGHLEPRAGDFDKVGPCIGVSPDEVDKIKNARWYSASGTIDIGYGF